MITVPYTPEQRKFLIDEWSESVDSFVSDPTVSIEAAAQAHHTQQTILRCVENNSVFPPQVIDELEFLKNFLGERIVSNHIAATKNGYDKSPVYISAREHNLKNYKLLTSLLNKTYAAKQAETLCQS